MRLESRITATALAVALLSSPTAAVGATSTAPQAPQVSWQTLSMLSPTAAIGFASAEQANPAAAPPLRESALPPPPNDGATGTPPLPVIGIWLATIVAAIYILTRDHHGHGIFPTPNSPA